MNTKRPRVGTRKERIKNDRLKRKGSQPELHHRLIVSSPPSVFSRRCAVSSAALLDHHTSPRSHGHHWSCSCRWKDTRRTVEIDGGGNCATRDLPTSQEQWRWSLDVAIEVGMIIFSMGARSQRGQGKVEILTYMWTATGSRNFPGARAGHESNPQVTHGAPDGPSKHMNRAHH